MYTHSMRTISCTFLCLWSGSLAAGVISDPLGTEKMLPPKPASYLGSASTDSCGAPASKGALNLLDVVNLTLCNNPQTREAWANARFQAAQVGVGRAAYLPNLDASASAGRDLEGDNAGENRRSISLAISYLLFDFGARSANLEAARELLAAAGATQDSTIQALFLASVQAYYQTQAALAALDAANESERAAKESFAAAEARYNAGTATPADKLQARTAYSQATLNRIAADGNLKNAQGILANIMGLDANAGVTLVPANTTAVPDSFQGDINALIDEARQRRPDLQAASAQVRAAEANVDATRAAGRPTISLNASSGQTSIAGVTSNNALASITLNVPLFAGFAPTYRVRAAEAQRDARTAQTDQLRLQVALDVWTAFQRLTTATQSLRSTADLLDSAEQSARVALGRYRAGVGSILDVLNAQSALASARQQRIQSIFNWNISRASLAQAVGSLDMALLQELPDTAGPQGNSDEQGGQP